MAARKRSGIPRVLLSFALGAFQLPAIANSEISATSAGSEDWPQWRGPNRDAVSLETSIVTSWPSNGPDELWRIPIGDGFSGISVADGRLYTLYGHAEGETALCVDAATGKEIWRHDHPGRFEEHRGDGPRSTPTIAAGKVYILGATGVLLCLDAQTGHVIWKRHLAAEYGGTVGDFGFSCSPLIEGDLVLVDIQGPEGQCILAFNRDEGQLAWNSTDHAASYSSPIAITAGGRRQAVFFNTGGLVGLDPSKGEVLWQYPWEHRFNIATPIHAAGQLFISTGYGHGCALVEFSSTADKGMGVRPLWNNSALKSHHANVVLKDGYLYGFDGNGPAFLTCVEMATGKEVWQTRGVEKGDLILAVGHLIIITQSGELVSVEATPEEYRERGRAQVLSGQCWTPPTLASGRLFLRNNENEMVSLDLRPKPAE